MAYGSRTRTPSIFYAPGFPKGVKWLLISNVAIFIAAFFLQVAELDRPLGYLHLPLVPAEVAGYFMVWQLVTYMFLHGGFGHIIWNMLALWMFGADLEQMWGTRKFLRYYFFCGVGAGICVVLLNYILPWGRPSTGTIGSSGAIYGILIACAVLFPTRTVLWGFLIPIQMKYFVMIYGVIAFMMSFQSGSNVSNFAHLGGLLFGYIFLKTPRMTFDLIGPIQRPYQEWKLRRAKKKFQVYLHKQNSSRDPWVH